MLTLLKIFFFFIALVFLFGFISRYLLGRYFKKMQDNVNQQYKNKHRNTRKEGDVTINPNSKKDKKHFKKEDGEYVDYEEIDE